MCQFLGVSILLLTLLTASTNAVPAEVRLGGLFPLFRTTGEVITSGQQRLSGFLLAVDEINALESILPQTKIKIVVKDTKLNAERAFFTSLNMAEQSFAGKGVDAVIGAQTSSETNAAATVFRRYSTVQISYSSSSPMLSSKINFPYLARSCPSDAFQGAAIADMVATHYKWTRVSTFANSDPYGSYGIQQFHSSAAKLGVKILSSSLFPVGQKDFTTQINEGLRSGARIFVFFMSALDMGNLLTQGYAAGLFGEGTQVVAGSACSVNIVWRSMPKDQVASIMKGVLAFSPYTNYSSLEGSSFLRKYFSQKNTVGNKRTGACDNRTDDDGNYLFQEAHNSAYPTVVNCSGQDFTHFNRDGSNIDVYASYAYDATYAIAKAMHVVLYEQKYPEINETTLYTALINKVSFMGATGNVSFSHAKADDSSRFGEGDRTSGIRYRILNFSPTIYENDPLGISGYEVVGEWDEINGNTVTSQIYYNTFDNSVPTDVPSPKKLKMTEAQIILMHAYFSVLFVFAAIFLLTLAIYRRTKFVKSIQSRLQCIMLFGAMCASARIYIGLQSPTDSYCSARVWLMHLSFWLIFAPMMLKTWRVNRIVNNRKYVALTEYLMLQYFMYIMLFVVVYMAILQIIPATTSRVFTIRTAVRNQVYLDQRCYRMAEGSEICLYVIEALFLMLTAGLCYATKNVPGVLNEAKNNIQAIAVGILVCAIISPLLLMSSDTSGSSKEFIRSTGIFLAVMSNICLLHGWRSVLLWLDFDIDPEHHLNRKNAVIPMLSIVCSGQGSSVKEGESTGESDYSSADCKPFDAVKTRNLVSRRVICQDQVNYWSAKLHHTEAMMLAQAEDGATLRIRRIIPGRLEDQKERIPPQAIECDTPYRGRAVPASAVSASSMSLDSRESTLRSGPNIGVESTSPVDSDDNIPDPLPPSSSSSPSSIR